MRVERKEIRDSVAIDSKDIVESGSREDLGLGVSTHGEDGECGHDGMYGYVAAHDCIPGIARN
jgi:hypothetical protein